MDITATPAVQRLIELALEEDLAGGDVTSAVLVAPGIHAEAAIVAKEPLVVAGLGVAVAVFHRVDAEIVPTLHLADGAQIAPGARLASFRGSARGLLAGERTALNFLQRLSGIATLTRAFVDAAKGTALRVTDTRKTTPGARLLEKHAVQM